MFFDSDYFPYIGYNENVELADPRRRREEKLGPLEDLAPRFDPYWTRMPDSPEKERAKTDQRVAEVFCRERDLTFSAPLRVSAKLESVSEHGEIRVETDEDIACVYKDVNTFWIVIVGR